MKYMPYGIAAVIIVLLFTIIARADVVHMKDGRKLEGEIVSETKDTIRLKMRHGEITIQRDEITKIEEKKTPAEDNAEQKDEIAQLRAEVERLKSENAILKKRIQELIETCKKAGIKVKEQEPEVEKGTYKYHDRIRDQNWFNRMYKKYRDKIALVDGNFLDIGKGVLYSNINTKGRYPNWDNPPLIGSTQYLRYRCEVLQVIGKTQILVWKRGTRTQYDSGGRVISPGTEDEYFQVRGFDTQGLVDGARFESGKHKLNLIYVGTFRYVSTVGAAKTVPSYMHYTPLTKKQFAQAIAAGFELVNYGPVKVKEKDSEWHYRIGEKHYKIVGKPEK